MRYNLCDYLRKKIKPILDEMPLDGEYLDNEEMDSVVENALVEIIELIEDLTFQYREPEHENDD